MSNTIRMTSHTKMTLTLAFVLAVTLCSVQGQVFTKGKSCPDPDVQQGFDVTRYMGKWHSYERFPFMIQDTRCNLANYTLNADNTVRVVNVAVAPFYVGNASCPLFRNVVTEGVAYIPDAKEPAKLKVDFSYGTPDDFKPDYWVLDTDYTNYTVIYNCRMTMKDGLITEIGKTETCFVMTRAKGVKPANLDSIHALLTKYDIDVTNMELMSQEGCPDWDGRQADSNIVG